MSWQDYVNFIRANNATSAAYIFGSDGTLWATHSQSDAGFLANYQADCEDESGKVAKHTVDEKKILLSCLANKGVCADKVVGIRFGGVKYQGLTYQDGNWFLKSREPKGGACVCVGAKCIVVGVYRESEKMTSGVGQNGGECNKVTMSLADKLREAGF